MAAELLEQYRNELVQAEFALEVGGKDTQRVADIKAQIAELEKKAAAEDTLAQTFDKLDADVADKKRELTVETATAEPTTEKATTRKTTRRKTTARKKA